MRFDVDLLKEFTTRCFIEDSFGSRIASINIMKQMPRYDKYLENKKKINELKSKQEHSPLMEPTYQEPILDKGQVLHLSRQYNYLKFCIIRNLDKPLTPKRQVQIMNIYDNAIKVRNLLATANFRLVGLVGKQIQAASICEADRGDYVASVYASIIKAVDYFDFRKGFNFNTYAVWSIKNNFYRYKAAKNKLESKMEVYEQEVASKEEDTRHVSNSNLTKKLLNMIEDKRQRLIIEKMYGISENAPATLAEVGSVLGVSRERVRQLKEEGLSLIRKKIDKKYNKFYEEAFL